MLLNSYEKYCFPLHYYFLLPQESTEATIINDITAPKQAKKQENKNVFFCWVIDLSRRMRNQENWNAYNLQKIAWKKQNAYGSSAKSLLLRCYISGTQYVCFSLIQTYIKECKKCEWMPFATSKSDLKQIWTKFFCKGRPIRNCPTKVKK